MINEVVVWDSALTANEVTALYNSGLPLLPTTDSGNYASVDDLVGYWRNDGVTTWTDRTPTDDPELVTNGDYSGWTVASGDAFTIESNGTLTVANTSTDSTVEYSFEVVKGRTYRYNTTPASASGVGLLYYVKQPNAGFVSFSSYIWSLTNYDFVASITGTASVRLYKYGGHNGNGVMATASIIRERGGNNGTVAGSPASIIVPEGLNEGRDSQGYYFSDSNSISSGIRLKGAEHIEVDNSDAFTFGRNDFSYDFWFKWTDAGHKASVTNAGAVMFTSHSTNGNNYSRLMTYQGTLFYTIKYGGSNVRTADSATGAISSANTWYHIALTVDRSSGAKWYINGSESTLSGETGATETTDLDFTGKFRIGAINYDESSDGSFIGGSIDEFRIYKSKVLSASEVLKSYNSGKSAHSN